MPRDHIVKVGDDWLDGMLVGRAAALSDWAFRKEQREFAQIVQRLQNRNYARRIRALPAGSRQRENLRAQQKKAAQKYNASVAGQAVKQAWQNRTRRAKAAKRPRKVSECRNCGAHLVAHPIAKIPRAYCNSACRQRWALTQRGRSPRHKCSLCGESGHNRLTCPVSR